MTYVADGGSTDTVLDFGNSDVVTLLKVTEAQFEVAQRVRVPRWQQRRQWKRQQRAGDQRRQQHRHLYGNAGHPSTPRSRSPTPRPPSASVNIWISGGLPVRRQAHDQRTQCERRRPRSAPSRDGNGIHDQLPSRHHHNMPTQPRLFLSAASGPPTTADFQAALQMIQFSPGAADGDRTVTWAAQDSQSIQPHGNDDRSRRPDPQQLHAERQPRRHHGADQRRFQRQRSRLRKSHLYGEQRHAAVIRGLQRHQLDIGADRRLHHGADRGRRGPLRAERRRCSADLHDPRQRRRNNASPDIAPTVNFTEPSVSTSNMALVAQSTFGGTARASGRGRRLSPTATSICRYNNGPETQTTSDNATIVAVQQRTQRRVGIDFARTLGTTATSSVSRSDVELESTPAGESFTDLTTDTHPAATRRNRSSSAFDESARNDGQQPHHGDGRQQRNTLL